MLPWYGTLSGRLDEHLIESELLRNNPLGDPSVRPLLVYVPPGYDAAPTRRYPTIYILQGYLGHLGMWRNRLPFQQPLFETADEVFAAELAPPAIVVYVDAWTAYGGSQFVDSTGTGRYHSYLCDEVVPWVDARYRTLDSPGHRGIAGKSSGGFGAMITPMLRPDLFGGFATHAGDAFFEYTCAAKFPLCQRFLRAYDGDIDRWWKGFQQRPPFTRPEDRSLLILYGLSACFSPGADGSPELPFEPRSGMLRRAVWQRWLDWDPIHMVPRYAAALRSMRAIWIDCGMADEQFFDIGAQAFRETLTDIGVPADVVHFELFPGGHGGVDHRYPLSLAWLARRLAPGD
jgi:S-formylglutathione hydrolase FrmB